MTIDMIIEMRIMKVLIKPYFDKVVFDIDKSNFTHISNRLYILNIMQL